MTSQALVVRSEVTARDEALALVAKSMPLGEEIIELSVSSCTTASDEAAANDATRVVKLVVISFPFSEHGVGGVLWQAAVVLAQHVATVEVPRMLTEARGRSLPPNVIELGCGSAALGGLAAAACGGFTATVTDLPEVLKLARRTLRRNGMAVAAARGGTDAGGAAAVVGSLALRWGEHLPPRLTSGPAVDLILGADVLYRGELHAALLETLRDLCEVGGAGCAAGTPGAASSGVTTASPRAILAFQSRHPDEEAAFVRTLCPRAGFEARALNLAGLPGIGDWHRARVRLLELTWRGRGSVSDPACPGEACNGQENSSSPEPSLALPKGPGASVERRVVVR